MNDGDPIEIRSRVVDWLADYLRQSGKKGYLIGLSGGVDSLTLSLMGREAAEKAGGSFLALLTFMDGNHDYSDATHARRLVAAYDIPCEEVDLLAAYAAFVETLFKAKNQVTYTNLKARLRTATHYFFANDREMLLLGTVNRGEFMIGYFPKNASAGDILPMAKLTKKQIRDIAATYGVSDSDRNRKASGCIFAETAEEEWGFSEDDLDAMCSMNDRAIRNEDGVCSSDTWDLFKALLEASSHKRQFYPVCPIDHL